MVDYQRLFDDMVIESQGDTYLHRSGMSNPISEAYDNGLRLGVLHGITLGYRTLAEAGHLQPQIYEDWHAFVYSEDMKDPQVYRKEIIRKRSEE